MPGVFNEQQAMDLFSTENRWFTVEGIPITGIDDDGQVNNFPLMDIQVFDKSTGDLLASLDVVLPVSQELHCSNCHVTDIEDTILSKAAADRTLDAKCNVPIDIAKETEIGCSLCHDNPL